jgi:hypothetical protein
LIAGNQSYLELKKKLFFSIPSIGIDLITGRQETKAGFSPRL